jgi:hypothetical protein
MNRADVIFLQRASIWYYEMGGAEIFILPKIGLL